MCTYSRKKIENLIDGAENLCRLCLENLQDPVPVFIDGKEQCISLSFRIMLCAGVELSYDENLSNSICKQCHEQVQSFYKFRKLCQSSYCKLKSHLQALKTKQRIKNGLSAENRFKIDDTSDEEQLVVNFDDSEPKIERNLCVENVDSVSSENQIQDCKKGELVEEETVEVVHEVRQERVIEAEVNPEDTEGSSPLEISTFLMTVLTDLGVIQKHDDGVELTQQGMTSIELKTSDNVIDMEIVEEDQEANPALPSNEPVIEDAPNSDEIVIRFVTSSSKTSHKATEEVSETCLEGQLDSENEDDPPSPKRDLIERVKVVCSECSKAFSTKSSLRRHLQLHSGEKPHACKVCGRRFTQLAVLKRHRLTHLETRPFQCDLCEKSFTQRSGLLAHARAHQPPNKRHLYIHKCTQCPKVFLYPSGLSRHMMTHNGRVYICVGCDKHFNDKSSLLRHLKSCKRQMRRKNAKSSQDT